MTPKKKPAPKTPFRTMDAQPPDEVEQPEVMTATPMDEAAIREMALRIAAAANARPEKVKFRAVLIDTRLPPWAKTTVANRLRYLWGLDIFFGRVPMLKVVLPVVVVMSDAVFHALT